MVGALVLRGLVVVGVALLAETVAHWRARGKVREREQQIARLRAKIEALEPQSENQRQRAAPSAGEKGEGEGEGESALVAELRRDFEEEWRAREAVWRQKVAESGHQLADWKAELESLRAGRSERAPII